MPAQEINLLLNYLIELIKNWWWLFLPFFLWKHFLNLYLFWRNDCWLQKQRTILLEIRLPRDVMKPIRAMETVMASIHGAVYHPPDWWEKWVEGQLQLSVAFEVISVGGEPHFFIRCGFPYRDAVESSIYAQYPGAEIQEADDYIKYVPQSIPNKEWDLWAADYKMLKDDHYPIKTYPQFETEHEALEEKRIDPVAALVEGLAKIKPGEQFWVQIIAEPVSEGALAAWMASGQELRDKLARRPEKAKPTPMVQEMTNILISGKTSAEVKTEERDIIPPEMKLTPGERDIIMGLELKISKPIFRTVIRFIYLGKRDVFFKPNFRLAFSFFNSYTTLNMNAIVPLGKTLTKIHKSWFLPFNLLVRRRHYLRCRKIFRNYIKRLPPFFPRPGGSFMLNTEEMASLFHFPSQIIAPTPGAYRIETKKGSMPPHLPTEK
ncbi:MAG: hypothetical protein ABIG08_00375 [bacterium]